MGQARMPAVSQDFEVHISNDPAEQNIADGKRAMYLDVLLSEYYGRMVRQGQSFKIQGIQASLKPDVNASGIDVGLSAEVTVDFVPVTKHARFAWNQVFKGWRNQKKLATAVGSQVRYDDMEFGWNAKESPARSRTSTIFGSGMSDALQEKLVLTGASTASSGTTVGEFSLQDYYNSAYETPDPSRDVFTGTDIKDPKWGDTPFPEIQTLHCTASSSAIEQAVGGFGGAITTGDVQDLSVPVQSLCGVLQVGAYIMPDDTFGQDEDDFILTLTVFVSSWKPLIFHQKRKARGRYNRGKGGKASGRRRTYRKYRRKR